jgi:iduronate 2-sulfatase
MELYDLKNDPGEFTNLARNPDYTTVLKTLKKRLLAKRNDAGFASNKAVIVEKVNLKKRIKR